MTPWYHYGYKGALGRLPTGVGVRIPFSYDIITPPINPVIELDLVKTHLKITGNSEDSYLEFLISAVVSFAQAYTRRTFLTTEYITFRHFFQPSFYIKQSPLQTVEKIEYKKDGVLTLVSPDVYYFTVENIYSSVILEDGESFPDDVDNELQSVIITFKAGYGDMSSDVPQDFILAMLNHIAMLYEDRGDCSDCSCSMLMPPATKAVYELYRIRDLSTGKQLS